MACIRTEEFPLGRQGQRICRRELFAEADIIAHPIEVLIDRLNRVNKRFKFFAMLGGYGEVQAYHSLSISGIECPLDKVFLCRSTWGFLIIMEEK